MKVITFIVCGNGFGHYRRCARIAYHLVKKEKSITINFICHSSAIRNLRDWYITEFIVNHSRIKHFDGQKKINLLNEINFDDVRDLTWLNKDMLMSSDIVISDNLSSILEIRSDAILMGSFLWSEVLINLQPKNRDIKKFHDYELHLLKTYMPIMISLKDMAMPYVQKYTKLKETSWVIDSFEKVKIKSNIKNILIMGGGTKMVDGDLIKIAKKLLKKNEYKIFVSYTLKEKLIDTNGLFVFDFKDKSFFNIDLFICRPGIGSITDAVKYGIPILGVGEPNNSEMQFNLKKIEELNFGLDISKRQESISEIIKIFEEDGAYLTSHKHLISTAKDGINETIKFLISKLNLN